MLTGDNPASAERVARKLGISRVHAALTPEQKLGRVKELKDAEGRGGGVIMVRPRRSGACLRSAVLCFAVHAGGPGAWWGAW